MTCCPSRPASFPSHTESGSEPSGTCRSKTETRHLRSPSQATRTDRCRSAVRVSARPLPPGRPCRPMLRLLHRIHRRVPSAYRVTPQAENNARGQADGGGAREVKQRQGAPPNALLSPAHRQLYGARRIAHATIKAIRSAAAARCGGGGAASRPVWKRRKRSSPPLPSHRVPLCRREHAPSSRGRAPRHLHLAPPPPSSPKVAKAGRRWRDVTSAPLRPAARSQCRVVSRRDWREIGRVNVARQETDGMFLVTAEHRSSKGRTTIARGDKHPTKSGGTKSMPGSALMRPERKGERVSLDKETDAMFKATAEHRTGRRHEEWAPSRLRPSTAMHRRTR